MSHLDDYNTRNQITKHLKERIDIACCELYADGFRNHLGASLIGADCDRYLWFVFRWAFIAPTETDGRMQRLFNRGHREEERMFAWLTQAGFQVFDRDPDSGNQWRIDGCFGDGPVSHFGGSLDAIAYFPESWEIEEPILVECKTNKTGKAFEDLKETGVQKNKWQHYVQQSTYGYAFNLNYSIYLNVNKNDDDLHVEIVKLDHRIGEDSVSRATEIITSDVPPPRISDNPTFYKCKSCDALGVCHKKHALQKNCRSCAAAQAIDNKQWYCRQWQQVIPNREAILAACDSWQGVI